MTPLNTDNENILIQYQSVIKAILREIKIKNIDINISIIKETQK